MYKVLDVREHKYTVARSCNTVNYSPSGSVSNDTHHEFVVICVDLETNARKRFIFYNGHKTEDKIWGTLYWGYKGDFNLLVGGDFFEIEKHEKDYDRVILLS